MENYKDRQCGPGKLNTYADYRSDCLIKIKAQREVEKKLTYRNVDWN